MKQATILCPDCKTEIDVNEVLYSQLQNQIEQKYKKDEERLKKEFEEREEEHNRKVEEFEKAKKRENEMFEKRLELKLKEAKTQLTTEIKKAVENESAERVELMETELKDKSEKLKELNRTIAENQKLKREKDELKDALEAELQERFNQQLLSEKERIKKQEETKSELRIKELEKKLEDQGELIEEMKRKKEQGSVQLQGEVQELGIEDWLKRSFPLDTILEVKKGARGADCKQIVNSRYKENCGSIYYESKRTKDFGKNWIEKFKDDIRENGANLGILVTDVLPPDMERMGLKDGVWICTYDEFKGLCTVLREHIVALDLALASQENKGEKMVMLYEYLTSNEFKLQIEGIMDSYQDMARDLEAEKRSITGHWKKREKQLLRVLNNTRFIYQSLRGIAGNAIQEVRVLELTVNLETEDAATPDSTDNGNLGDSVIAMRENA